MIDRIDNRRLDKLAYIIIVANKSYKMPFGSWKTRKSDNMVQRKSKGRETGDR